MIWEVLTAGVLKLPTPLPHYPANSAQLSHAPCLCALTHFPKQERWRKTFRG